MRKETQIGRSVGESQREKIVDSERNRPTKKRYRTRQGETKGVKVRSMLVAGEECWKLSGYLGFRPFSSKWARRY